MYVPVLIELMCIIDFFSEETPPGKFPRTKEFFCLSFIFFFWPNTQDKYMPYGSKGTSWGDLVEAMVDCCGCSWL